MRIFSILLFLIYSSLIVEGQSLPASTPCNQASEVFCGDEISLSSSDLSSDPFSYCDIGYHNSPPSAWFYLIGTGEAVYIDLGGSDVSVGIFTGTCSQFSCTPCIGFIDPETSRYDVRYII